MIDASVIIVHRNGPQVLLNCLKSLKSEALKEIFVVDNASADKSILLAKQLASRLKLPLTVLSNSTNNGFAEANNQAFALATGKYIVFLNNDTVVTKGFLAPLIRVLERNRTAAAVQPIIAFPDDTIDSIGSYFTPLGFLYHKAHRVPLSEVSVQEAAVYSLKGACMVWKKKVLDEVGPFDKSFFAYFEETELCHRAINSGYRLLFSPNSRIMHFGGYTSNSMNQAFIQFCNTKNRFITYLKHLPADVLLSVGILHLVLTEVLILKLFFSSWKVAFATQRGVILGLLQGLRARAQFEQSHEILPLPAEVMKKPDYSYYLALFSSLKNYRKIW